MATWRYDNLLHQHLNMHLATEYRGNFHVVLYVPRALPAPQEEKKWKIH